MVKITYQDGKVVFRDGKAGTEINCCCGGGGCPGGPWCVNISWDLLFDDINDGMPGIQYQGSAIVWVGPDNAVRKCKNGVAVNDAPLTDIGCTGTTIADFCDGGYINYGGEATGPFLIFTFEFNASEDTGFPPLVLFYRCDRSDTLLQGVNVINAELNVGIMLIGTVTFSIQSDTAEAACGC